MKMKTGNGVAPSRFNYADYIPGYDAGDNPLGDITTPPESNPPMYDDPILPGGRPLPPTPIPPPTTPIDPGLGGGDGSGSSSGYGPGLLPSPPTEVPIDPGLIGGDSPAGINPPPPFQVHMMYDCATGQAYQATTQAEHEHYSSLGYVHDLSECKIDGSGPIKDFRLIGGIAIVILGGLIVRSYRK